MNGYAHNLEISNNYVTGNSGVLHGGIRVGHPSLPLAGDGPFEFNRNVRIHHNAITLNGAQSDAGVAGGVALSTGSQNYSVSRNFVCGNFNMGDGGGIGHLGLSTPGLIEFNQILFNQSFNQGLNRSGGGVVIAGEPSAAGGLTLGAGNVVVDGNLIQGNHAATGHGGGIRTQLVNGRDVAVNPFRINNWYRVSITNNMIVNNVAGWSGAGISLQDTVNGSIVLNTIANNDTHRHGGRRHRRGDQHLHAPAGRHLLGAQQPGPGRGHPGAGRPSVAEELLEPGAHQQHRVAQSGIHLQRDEWYRATAARPEPGAPSAPAPAGPTTSTSGCSILDSA